LTSGKLSCNINGQGLQTKGALKMNNPELCRYYMQQENKVKIIPNVPDKNIIDILDETFDKNWTWELTDE